MTGNFAANRRVAAALWPIDRFAHEKGDCLDRVTYAHRDGSVVLEDGDLSRVHLTSFRPVTFDQS
jgi:hypothetical protein